MSAVLDSLPQLPTKPDAGRTINGKRIRVPPRVTLGEITPNNIGTLKKLNLSLFPVSYSDRFYKDVLDVNITPEEYSRLVFYQDVPVGNLICRLQPLSAPVPVTMSASISPPSGLPSAEVPSAGTSSSTGSATKVKANGAASAPEPCKLYIMTLGVLSPYRRQGLATKLISHLIAAAESSHIPPPAPVSAAPSDADAKSATVNGDSKKVKDEPKAEPDPVKPVIESLYLHVQVSNTDARAFWERNGFEVTDTVKNYYRKLEPSDAWILERKVSRPSAAA